LAREPKADILSAMLFYDRPDGRRVRGLSPFDAILPYVVRKKNDAAVLFSKDIDVEAAMAYVRRKNAETGKDLYSLFGILIAALVRAIALKPRLNRFVHRRAFYQRESISVSFIVKKSFPEISSEGNAKIKFQAEDDVAAVMAKISQGIERARGSEKGRDDREYEFAHRVPLGKAILTSAFRILDRYNIAPAAMIEADPLFTSVYVANLGSIGLDTPYHQLYEWGSASVFMVVGRVFQQEAKKGGPAARGAVELKHFVNLKFTVDERIVEGIYFAHALAFFKKLVSKPELLELALDQAETEA
jgi:hypothetical protein